MLMEWRRGRTRSLLVLGFTFFIIGIAFDAYAQGGGNADSPPGPSVRFIKAIVIDERLSALRHEPDISSEIIRRVSLEGTVYLIKQGPTALEKKSYYRIAATRRTRGWMLKEAVIQPGKAGEDKRLHKVIMEAGGGFDRLTRCRIFIEKFPQSVLMSSVLLILGEEAELEAADLSKRARGRLKDEKPAHDSLTMKDLYLNDTGLDRYNKLRILYRYSEESGSYVYDGQAYRELIRRFPNSPEASIAQSKIRQLESRLAASTKQ